MATIVTIPVYGDPDAPNPIVPARIAVNPDDWLEFVLGDDVSVCLFIGKADHEVINARAVEIFGMDEVCLTPSFEGRRVRSPIKVGTVSKDEVFNISVTRVEPGVPPRGGGIAAPIKGTIVVVGSGPNFLPPALGPRPRGPADTSSLT